MVAGALAVFVAAPAVPRLRHRGGNLRHAELLLGWSVDLGAASLLPTLLLVPAALSLPRRRQRPARAALGRLAAGLAPGVIAAVYLFPGPAREPTIGSPLLTGPAAEDSSLGPPYPMPWIPESRPLLRILGLALLVAVVFTWRTARTRPAWALASGLVLASVAYPLAWADASAALPVPYWGYGAPYYWAAAAVPFLLALTLMRRAGRAPRPHSGEGVEIVSSFYCPVLGLLRNL